jgi:glyoxylase-like metal-dependent hydrolase (beta-lactamase superfamily II)
VTKPWLVDDLVIHKIVEEERGYNTIDRFLPNLGPQRLADNLDWFADNGYEPGTGTVFLSYHCFLVQTPQHIVLIDTCIGNDKNIPVRDSWTNRHDTRWLEEFAATGIRFEDVDYVLCTHLHADHVGWNTRRKNEKWIPTFPNARYVVIDTEYNFTRDWVKLHSENHFMAPVYTASFTESVVPLNEAGSLDLVDVSQTLVDYFRFVPTPGHTPGHVAIAAGRGHDAVVFTGDLIHSPIQALYPEIVMPTDEDPQLAARTRHQFLQRFGDSGTLICTMHFPTPSAGYFRHWRDGYRLEYVTP